MDVAYLDGCEPTCEWNPREETIKAGEIVFIRNIRKLPQNWRDAAGGRGTAQANQSSDEGDPASH